MNRLAPALAVALLAIAAYVAAQSGMMPHMRRGMGMMSHSRVRRRYVTQHGIGRGYAGKSNPLPDTRANIAAGRRLYDANCAACHGVSGAGDGVAGKNLDPRPSRLTGLGRMRMASDGYLYWTIAEGGKPVKSAMPAYKQSLKSNNIWKLVLFLRTL